MLKIKINIRKLLKRFLIFIGIIVFLLIVATMLLQTSYIQTYITKYVTEYLSKKIKTEIKIEKVKISLTKGIILNKIYIEDENKDTLLYVSKLTGTPYGIPTSVENISLLDVEIDSLTFNLIEIGKGKLNIDFIIEALSSAEESKKEDTKFNISCNNFSLKNSQFHYKAYNKLKTKGLDFNNLWLKDINLDVTDITVNEKNISLALNKLSLKDHSGIEITELSTISSKISENGILLSNLKLQTPETELNLDSLNLKYNSYSAFSNIFTDVKFEANIQDSSYFSTNDIAYFVPQIKNVNYTINIGGTINGAISDLQVKNLKIYHKKAISLQLNSHVKGLPEVENLFFDIDVKKLTANIQEIKNIRLANDTIDLFSLPEGYKGVKIISYNGRTKGRINNFTSQGKIAGSFGKISVDISAESDSISEVNIKGLFNGENLDIASAIGNKDFGRLTFSQNINFKLLKTKKIQLKTFGSIDSVSYKNHKYRNIKLYADVNDKIVDTISIIIDNKDIKTKITAFADFNRKKPKINFSVIVDTINFKNLNLKKDKTIMSFSAEGDFSGLNIDDFSGNIKLKKKLIYKTDSLELKVNNFKISSEIIAIEPQMKKTTIESDFANAKIIHSGKFSEQITAINKLFNSFLPALIPYEELDENASEELSEMKFDIDLKNTKSLTKIFFPELYIAKKTKITGAYSLNNNKLNVVAKSKYIRYNNNVIDKFYFIAETKDSILYVNIGGDTLKSGKKIELENFNISSKLKNDSIGFNLSWNNLDDSANLSANINGIVQILKNENKKAPKINCNFRKSKITIDNNTWKFDSAEIKVDTSYIEINNFVIKNKKQQIYINGIISEIDGHILTVDFNKFNLKNLKPALSKDLDLKGILNGKVRIANIYLSPVLITNDTINNLELNNIKLGNLFFSSEWENDYNKIRLFTSMNNVVKNDIQGKYWAKKDSLDFNIDIYSLKLAMFKSYFEDYIGVNRSSLKGNIKINGYTKSPKIDGLLGISRGFLAVKYLGTSYTLQNMQFAIDNHHITIKEGAELISGHGTRKAKLKGTIYHENFTNFNTDIQLKANNFKLLNTQPSDTSFFYGVANGTGDVNISGPFNDIVIDINLTTDKGTVFYLPLSNSEILSETNSFMSFVSNQSDDNESFEAGDYDEEFEVNDSGLKLNLDLKVTPDAQIQLIMDESMGDIIKANGYGDMKIQIDTRSDFNMFGDYTITKGDYLFTMKSILSKHFTIKNGGTIKWTGDPLDADINLETVYSLRNVKLSDLSPDDESYIGAKVKTECNIAMKGKLLSPDIAFGVSIPDGAESLKQQIESLDRDNINKQFLSLLIIGSFQPLPGMSQEAIGGSPSQAGEVLSNQLNRWLSDISDDFDVGVNYQIGDQVTSDELEVALSTQLWDDRVTINGNVGVGGTVKEESAENTSSFIGEVEVDVKLNKTGTFKMKVFNKANDRISYDQGPYKQGIGIFWKKEFNSIFRKRKKIITDSLKVDEK